MTGRINILVAARCLPSTGTGLFAQLPRGSVHVFQRIEQGNVQVTSAQELERASLMGF